MAACLEAAQSSETGHVVQRERPAVAVVADDERLEARPRRLQDALVDDGQAAVGRELDAAERLGAEDVVGQRRQLRAADRHPVQFVGGEAALEDVDQRLQRRQTRARHGGQSVGERAHARRDEERRRTLLYYGRATTHHQERHGHQQQQRRRRHGRVLGGVHHFDGDCTSGAQSDDDTS